MRPACNAINGRRPSRRQWPALAPAVRHETGEVERAKEMTMMRRIQYVVATSLDGYIAGPKGEADCIITDPEIDFRALWTPRSDDRR